MYLTNNDGGDGPIWRAAKPKVRLAAISVRTMSEVVPSLVKLLAYSHSNRSLKSDGLSAR